MKKVMRSAKKTLAFCLAAVMGVGALAGCGKNGDKNGGAGTKKSEEPITLTVFSQRANYSGEQVGWSAQLLKEKFNVILNIVPDGDGVLDTRMESGNLGDIIVFGSETDYLRAMKSGLLFDWEEDDTLKNEGAYINEHMIYDLEKNRGMSDDGKIYGLGYDVAENSEDIQSFFYTWDLRWDLYSQLGYPEVKNMKDYLEMLKKMKEICPTDDAGTPTYAVSLWPDWDGNMVMYVKSTATAYYGYDEFELGLYDPTDGHFYGALGNPNDPSESSPYLEMLDFYHQLYANDLLDPDSMTATYDTMSEKVKKGGTFFSIFNYSGSLSYNTETHTSENKIMRSFEPSEASPIVYGLNVLGGNNYWAIGSNSAYPEVAMEVINYLCTPEGRMNFEYGPQGVTWDYDEDGNTYFTELGKKTNTDGSTEMADGYTGTFKDGQLQINCVTWNLDCNNPDSNGETYNDQAWKSEQGDAICDIDQDWREKTGCVSVNDYMLKGNYTVSPGSAYVQAEKTDELKATWEQVTKCIVNGSWNAIYTKTDEEYKAVVDKMIQDAMAYGYEECWSFSNDQAAVRKAAEDAVTQ